MSQKRILQGFELRCFGWCFIPPSPVHLIGWRQSDGRPPLAYQTRLVSLISSSHLTANRCHRCFLASTVSLFSKRQGIKVTRSQPLYCSAFYLQYQLIRGPEQCDVSATTRYILWEEGKRPRGWILMPHHPEVTIANCKGEVEYAVDLGFDLTILSTA